jgi:protein-tyrosine phosphatase
MVSAIALQGASNLRDLGGWPAAAGRRVCYGLLYRAPALIGLTAEDEATIAALGLRTVCDLRGVREREVSPVALGDSRNVHLPIEPSVGAGLRDILRTGQASGQMAPTDMFALLREAYESYALVSVGQYRKLFEHILAPGGLPLLLHCSAGKDRTGFGSALILTALGVGWDDVLDDYLATNTQWRREIAAKLDLPAELADVLLSVHPDLLTAAFNAARSAYGSIDAYLHNAVGLDAAARARLAELLLEPYGGF